MKKDFAKKITDQIKQKKIIPKTKWQCNWKNYLLWAAWAVVIVSGSLLFSLSILRFVGFHLGAFHFLRPRGVVGLLFQMTPYLVIGLTGIVIVLGYYLFKGTKRGYRHSTLFVSAAIILAVILLGSFFHLLKINHRFEDGLSKRVPRYQKIIDSDKQRIDHPERGFLAGTIIKIQTKELELKSFHNKNWVVFYKKTDIRPRKLSEELKIGDEVLVIGKIQKEGSFDAQLIKELKPPEEKPERREEDMGKGARVKVFRNQHKTPGSFLRQ